MLCPYCGTNNRHDAGFCLKCRATLGPAAAPPPAHTGAQPPTDAWQAPYYDRAPAPQLAFTYAAFWPRFGAWLLDSLFSTLLAAIPGVALAVVLGLAVAANQEEPVSRFEEDNQDGNIALAAFGGFLLGYLPVYFGYHTIANAKGGGWGKRIVGLRVLKETTGENPGYGTGFLRIFITRLIGFISIISLLDHLWCIWDRQKQTWHDKIAGTVVVAVS